MKSEFVRENLKLMRKLQDTVNNKYNGKLFNLTISGSHLYGFESKNSDIDYRGMYVVNTHKLLGLKKPKKVIEIMDKKNDIVLFEIEKEIKLCLAGNCNALERINAKQIYNCARFIDLKKAINNAWGKRGIYNSYKGLATSNYKKFILKGKQNAKKYLYIFRALMAGIYALQTGQIEPNIRKLNKTFKLDCVDKLIEIKEEKELIKLPQEMMDGTLEKEIDKLFDKIDKAYEKSKIPEKPSEEEIKEVNSIILKIRKENLV